MLRAFDTRAPLSRRQRRVRLHRRRHGPADVRRRLRRRDPARHARAVGLAQLARTRTASPSTASVFRSSSRTGGVSDTPTYRKTAVRPRSSGCARNPHRLHLGRLGFRLLLADGREAARDDVRGVEQVLDLWQGVLRSRFTLEGQPVEVETLCHPRKDAIAVRVRSPLVASGRLAASAALSLRKQRDERDGLDEARRAHDARFSLPAREAPRSNGAWTGTFIESAWHGPPPARWPRRHDTISW